MTLIELSEFVKQFEGDLRRDRRCPVAVAAAPPPVALPVATPVPPRKDSFDVVPEAAGDKDQRHQWRCAPSPRSA